MSSIPEFWSDSKRSTRLMREKASLERKLSEFAALEDALEEAEVMLELGEEEGDEETIVEAGEALAALEPRLAAAEIRRLFAEDADERDAILEINSGAGGTDASDWAEMLKRMYLQWATHNGFKVSIIDEQPHDEAGIKSCTMEVKGLYAYGYLKSEIGVHRLVRISPFDASARRHTAFASVNATPDIDDSIEVEINDSELRIDTMRAGGAGGQHVNTTDSAVRITHLPTGIVVKCQNERSQHKNKALALKVLKARIYQHELRKRQDEIDALNSEKKRIEWGSQIRSYVLHPYRMVKDLRTEYQSGNTDAVLNGALTPFMESYLASQAEEREA